MTKGILWVSSRITRPEELSAEKFCEWYENIHIQQVLSLPGLPSAIRYEAIQPQPDGGTWSKEAPWLTIYEMTDISYRSDPAFLALDGQAPPSQELLDGVFRNARFDTRFYEEVQVYDNPNLPSNPLSSSATSPSATSQSTTIFNPSPSSCKRFMISAALEPPPSAIADFDQWYRREHLSVLAQAPGYIRTRRYELVNGTTLNEFERLHPDPPGYLALHEFEAEQLPWGELEASAGTGWARRVMGGLVKAEAGWYVKKREYPESEWGGVGK